MSEVYKGVVKSIVEGRGFLFLSPPERGAKDIFCHITEFEKAGLRSPEKGERYEYQIQMTPKGPQAIDIRPV